MKMHISPMPELELSLKKLRLLGVHEHLAQRNKEAVDSKMSFMEFLSLVLQDELQRRHNAKFIKRFKASHINENKTLEQFDFNFNPHINQQYIKDLGSCRFIDEKAPILIVGPCGTGKSHLAQAIAHCAIRADVETLFFTQTQVLRLLQKARAIGDYDRKFQKLITIPLLIIDDFGLKPLKNTEEEDFHDLVAERYERTSTIITSNLDCSEWTEAFPNKLLGAATVDRLGHRAYKVILDGSSYRSAVANRKKSAKLEG